MCQYSLRPPIVAVTLHYIFNLAPMKHKGDRASSACEHISLPAGVQAFVVKCVLSINLGDHQINPYKIIEMVLRTPCLSV